eukprot:TRINITY_DN771_c2_g1_i2.p1 TRINITY_DN771_c2_g1~~TRINITY_DN771_c2_g1_i2.p1  ORF type:complete len:507 (-),score=38.97 TRINITY_DN771_c2_g1_i2:826-2346(-)
MKRNKRFVYYFLLFGFVFNAPLENDVVGETGGESLAIDLVNSTFHIEVGKVTEEFSVLMEFYASWCPACRHFKPDFEKIANYFNKQPRVKPEVWVARVDCATEHDLCRVYEVHSYPTLLLGRPQDFQSDVVSKLSKYSGARQPTQIVNWIANYTKGSYNFKDEGGHHTEEELHKEKSKQATLKVTEESLEDIEKATLLAFEEIVTADLEGKRLAVIEILTLLSTAHPSKRCKEGLSKLVSNFNDFWKPSLSEPESTLKNYKVCGEDATGLLWKQCKGTKEDTRGFTCGLWTLFHSLSTRVEKNLGGLAWLRGVEAYIRHFFGCSTCQKHFLEMITKSDAQAITSRRDAVMWMWNTHNKVNKRLAQEEKDEGTGDPGFPKIQWPPASVCSDCYLTNNEQEPAWSYPHVYKFLMHYYGGVEIDLEPESNFHALKQPTTSPVIAPNIIVNQPKLRGGAELIEQSNLGESEGRSILYPLIVISVVVVSLVYCMRREARNAINSGVYDRSL